MQNKLFIFLLIVGHLLFPSLSTAATPKILGNLDFIKNNIIVNLSVAGAAELESAIKSGIKKEINFTVELIRQWRFWPDEFVVSKKIRKIVNYDNLREQYWASSFDGVIFMERQFENYQMMRDWIFTVNAVNIANVKELDQGDYYIRIVVESKTINPVPVMGLLIHLIPEVEMSLAKESQPFFIGDRK